MCAGERVTLALPPRELHPHTFESAYTLPAFIRTFAARCSCCCGGGSRACGCRTRKREHNKQQQPPTHLYLLRYCLCASAETRSGRQKPKWSQANWGSRQKASTVDDRHSGDMPRSLTTCKLWQRLTEVTFFVDRFLCVQQPYKYTRGGEEEEEGEVRAMMHQGRSHKFAEEKTKRTVAVVAYNMSSRFCISCFRATRTSAHSSLLLPPLASSFFPCTNNACKASNLFTIPSAAVVVAVAVAFGACFGEEGGFGTPTMPRNKGLFFSKSGKFAYTPVSSRKKNRYEQIQGHRAR